MAFHKVPCLDQFIFPLLMLFSFYFCETNNHKNSLTVMAADCADVSPKKTGGDRWAVTRFRFSPQTGFHMGRWWERRDGRA